MEELLKILREHKGGKAISIIVPIENTPFAHRTNEERVKSSVDKAVHRLKELGEYSGSIADNLSAIMSHIDFTQPGEGTGIFVSAEIAKWVSFQLPVQEKMMVGETFELRDLLYNIAELKPYYALILSNKHARLLKERGRKMEEIHDTNFPMKFEEEYQFDKTPDPVSPGVEVSAVKEMREVQYLRKIDHALSHVLFQEELPVILMGIAKHISFFIEISKNAKHIVAKVDGNFDHLESNKIETVAMNEMYAYRKIKRIEQIKSLQEAIGRGLCAVGIDDVYHCAIEGKGRSLFVERSYVVMGELNATSYTIAGDAVSKTSVDIVNTIVNEAIAKGGDVIFADDSELSVYGRIALLLRYA